MVIWDEDYEELPPDNVLSSEFDDNIRSTKQGIGERLKKEHILDDRSDKRLGLHKEGSARISVMDGSTPTGEFSALHPQKDASLFRGRFRAYSVSAGDRIPIWNNLLKLKAPPHGVEGFFNDSPAPSSDHVFAVSVATQDSPSVRYAYFSLLASDDWVEVGHWNDGDPIGPGLTRDYPWTAGELGLFLIREDEYGDKTLRKPELDGGSIVSSTEVGVLTGELSSAVYDEVNGPPTVWFGIEPLDNDTDTRVVSYLTASGITNGGIIVNSSSSSVVISSLGTLEGTDGLRYFYFAVVGLIDGVERTQIYARTTSGTVQAGSLIAEFDGVHLSDGRAYLLSNGNLVCNFLSNHLEDPYVSTWDLLVIDRNRPTAEVSIRRSYHTQSYEDEAPYFQVYPLYQDFLDGDKMLIGGAQYDGVALSPMEFRVLDFTTWNLTNDTQIIIGDEFVSTTEDKLVILDVEGNGPDNLTIVEKDVTIPLPQGGTYKEYQIPTSHGNTDKITFDKLLGGKVDTPMRFHIWGQRKKGRTRYEFGLDDTKKRLTLRNVIKQDIASVERNKLPAKQSLVPVDEYTGGVSSGFILTYDELPATGIDIFRYASAILIHLRTKITKTAEMGTVTPDSEAMIERQLYPISAVRDGLGHLYILYRGADYTKPGLIEKLHRDTEQMIWRQDWPYNAGALAFDPGMNRVYIASRLMGPTDMTAILYVSTINPDTGVLTTRFTIPQSHTETEAYNKYYVHNTRAVKNHLNHSLAMIVLPSSEVLLWSAMPQVYREHLSGTVSIDDTIKCYTLRPSNNTYIATRVHASNAKRIDTYMSDQWDAEVRPTQFDVIVHTGNIHCVFAVLRSRTSAVFQWKLYGTLGDPVSMGVRNWGLQHEISTERPYTWIKLCSDNNSKMLLWFNNEGYWRVRTYDNSTKTYRIASELGQSAYQAVSGNATCAMVPPRGAEPPWLSVSGDALITEV